MVLNANGVNFRSVIIGPGSTPPPPTPITITAFNFTAYDGPSFIVQKLPFGAPSFLSVPYTWNPVTDMQFVLNPGETITVQLTMSGYTGAVTGTDYTTGDGEYVITGIGQTGNLYTFTIFNAAGGPSTIPESLTFTVTDSVSSVGTYTVTVTDIFT